MPSEFELNKIPGIHRILVFITLFLRGLKRRGGLFSDVEVVTAQWRNLKNREKHLKQNAPINKPPNVIITKILVYDRMLYICI